MAYLAYQLNSGCDSDVARQFQYEKITDRLNFG
jgi:hypothetical protein